MMNMKRMITKRITMTKTTLIDEDDFEDDFDDEEDRSKTFSMDFIDLD